MGQVLYTKSITLVSHPFNILTATTTREPALKWIKGEKIIHKTKKGSIGSKKEITFGWKSNNGWDKVVVSKV